MSSQEENNILKAWKKNGHQWIQVIENQAIKSRAAATNQAMIGAISSINPSNFLDMGCGEGWLCRALEERGISPLGTDGVKELIEYAQSQGNTNFLLASYEDICAGKVEIEDKFDAIGFNFSLFGDQNTNHILAHIKSNLTKKGQVLIQTIHPQNPILPENKNSTWMTENWQGFEEDFTAFNWYARSEAEWHDTFTKSGLELIQTRTIKLPEKSEPFSIIFQLGAK